MKTLTRSAVSLPRSFKLFIAVISLLSIVGGYQLYQLIYKINIFSLQHTDSLLEIEEGLDSTAIDFGRQIQEWKDMLLRSDDEKLYSKHRKAFINSSIDVQQSLQRTMTAMTSSGIDPKEVELLRIEHKALVSNYVLAQTRLIPKRIESFREVDKQIMGIDRSLQQHIASVKANIKHLSEQQLSGTLPTQRKRYLTVGLLGGSSLMFMALIGFIFASRFQAHETDAAEYLSAG